MQQGIADFWVRKITKGKGEESIMIIKVKKGYDIYNGEDWVEGYETPYIPHREEENIAKLDKIDLKEYEEVFKKLNTEMPEFAPYIMGFMSKEAVKVDEYEYDILITSDGKVRYGDLLGRHFYEYGQLNNNEDIENQTNKKVENQMSKEKANSMSREEAVKEAVKKYPSIVKIVDFSDDEQTRIAIYCDFDKWEHDDIGDCIINECSKLFNAFPSNVLVIDYYLDLSKLWNKITENGEVLYDAEA